MGLKMQKPMISKKKKFVADGCFRAELDEFLAKFLAEDGYAGVEVRITPVRTQIIICATHPIGITGNHGQRVSEIASLIQKRFNFKEGIVECYVMRVASRGLSAGSMAESLRHKLLNHIAVRRAAYAIVRTIMNAGATGCEVVVSGKERAQAMKFKDGYLLTQGHPAQLYVESATRSLRMKQGVLGVRVRIMKPHDPTGVKGPKEPVPDTITFGKLPGTVEKTEVPAVAQ